MEQCSTDNGASEVEGWAELQQSRKVRPIGKIKYTSSKIELRNQGSSQVFKRTNERCEAEADKFFSSIDALNNVSSSHKLRQSISFANTSLGSEKDVCLRASAVLPSLPSGVNHSLNTQPVSLDTLLRMKVKDELSVPFRQPVQLLRPLPNELPLGKDGAAVVLVLASDQGLLARRKLPVGMRAETERVNGFVDFGRRGGRGFGFLRSFVRSRTAGGGALSHRYETAAGPTRTTLVAGIRNPKSTIMN